MRARRKPLWTSPLPADPPTGAQVVGHGREVLALVELGPVTLEALPDGVFDVAGQGGGGLAVPLQDQHGRPGLVGDAPPNLHHHATAWAPAGGGAAARPRRSGGITCWRCSAPGYGSASSPGSVGGGSTWSAHCLCSKWSTCATRPAGSAAVSSHAPRATPASARCPSRPWWSRRSAASSHPTPTRTSSSRRPGRRQLDPGGHAHDAVPVQLPPRLPARGRPRRP
jgi:hypothetical protein